MSVLHTRINQTKNIIKKYSKLSTLCSWKINLNSFQSFQEDKCNSVNFKDKAIKII